jgi:hypothetical protein
LIGSGRGSVGIWACLWPDPWGGATPEGVAVIKKGQYSGGGVGSPRRRSFTARLLAVEPFGLKSERAEDAAWNGGTTGLGQLGASPVRTGFGEPGVSGVWV